MQHYYISGAAYGSVPALLYRDYEQRVYVALLYTGVSSAPQSRDYVGQNLIAHAVMDDFGSLVIVRGWM